MLNAIFLIGAAVALLVAAATGAMDEMTRQMLAAMKNAVNLAIGLVGAMAFFLGLMKVAEKAGLLRILSRAVGPVMRRLFPGVPEDHPAMSAMILNISANMLGLANAATPFGIRAMDELDKLNTRKGTATNAMCLFLAINTAGLALIPSGVATLRVSLDSQNPWGHAAPTWFASGCATVVGICAAMFLSRLPAYRSSEPPPPEPEQLELDDGVADASQPELPGVAPAEDARPVRHAGMLMGIYWLVFISLYVVWVARTGLPTLGLRETVQQSFSFWVLPPLIVGILLFGWSRGVRVYDTLVEGAKEGFQVALRIIPYLVAILALVAMLRASGIIPGFVAVAGEWTARLGMPAEALPMALLRPLSGSGAYGIAAEIMQHNGPDSFVGYMVSTFQGSTETTFYVLAVYFGAVGVKKTRYALPACLLADVAGIAAAVFIVNLLFG